MHKKDASNPKDQNVTDTLKNSKTQNSLKSTTNIRKEMTDKLKIFHPIFQPASQETFQPIFQPDGSILTNVKQVIQPIFQSIFQPYLSEQ